MIFYTATCLHQRCDSVLMQLADEQVRILLIRSRQQVLRDLELLLPALFDALGGGSDRVVLEALSVQVGALCTGPWFSSYRAPVLHALWVHFCTLTLQACSCRMIADCLLLQQQIKLVAAKLAAALSGVILHEVKTSPRLPPSLITLRQRCMACNH